MVLCLGLLALSPAAAASEPRLLSLGLRAGTTGAVVIGGEEDERFRQFDVFATAALPWSWYHESGWGVSSRLLASAGALTGAGAAGLVGTLVPLVAFGPRNGALSLDGGIGAAVLTRAKFGEQDFGGAFQFALTFGLRVPIHGAFALAYRMQHLSDAAVHGDESNGADLHMLELTYRF